jgi:hypothetical protein
MANFGGPKGDPHAFAVGQAVRFKPGVGTYGYEDATGEDGRVPARVVALTDKRVRIEFPEHKWLKVRAVDAASLVAV